MPSDRTRSWPSLYSIQGSQVLYSPSYSTTNTPLHPNAQILVSFLTKALLRLIILTAVAKIKIKNHIKLTNMK